MCLLFAFFPFFHITKKFLAKKEAGKATSNLMTQKCSTQKMVPKCHANDNENVLFHKTKKIRFYHQPRSKPIFSTQN